MSRRVVSDHAERWIAGELTSASYFASARSERLHQARVEIAERLDRL